MPGAGMFSSPRWLVLRSWHCITKETVVKVVVSLMHIQKTMGLSNMLAGVCATWWNLQYLVVVISLYQPWTFSALAAPVCRLRVSHSLPGNVLCNCNLLISGKKLPSLDCVTVKREVACSRGPGPDLNRGCCGWVSWASTSWCPMNLTSLSFNPSVTLLCLWHIFHGHGSKAAGPHTHLWTRRHTHTHQLTPCLSHGLYLSRVRTHKALVGPALHTARPYIYPPLLLRVTNMGTSRRVGGSPSYLPTMWSGPYIVMIVSVTVALTSTYRFTSAQSPGWLNAKRWPSPLSATHSDWVLFLNLPSFTAQSSFTYFMKTNLAELVALLLFPHLCYLCVFALNQLVKF